MRLFILLLSILTATTTQAAVSTSDRALIERGDNLLKNGGFEGGKASWSASGGTFTTTTTSANVGKGGVAGSWDSSGAAQTLTSTAVAIPAGMYGRNGVASCLIQGSGATHTIEAYDGTNILATQTITSQADYTRTSVNFIFPTSGNVSLRLVSVNAAEPIIYIDDCYLGPADTFNLSQVSQASLIGSLTWETTTNCLWSSTNTSFADFAADTDCDDNARTATGKISDGGSPSGQTPAFTITNGDPGEYLVVVTGAIGLEGTGASTANAASYRLYDGSSQYGKDGRIKIRGASAALANQSPSFTFNFSYSGGTKTLKLQSAASGTNAQTYIEANAAPLSFYVYRFPTTSEIAYRADLVNWKVDANIAGANPSLGTSAVTSYTGIENGSLTLTNNTGSGNLTAQIPCSSTNSPSGTTCSSGNESVGVSFTVPTAGDVRACASFSHDTTCGGGACDARPTFQIVETPINAQTISQEGKSRIQVGASINTSNSFQSPFQVCGTFSFASVGQKALRLMFEQSVAGTLSSSTVLADAGASNGQRDIHWEVYPINQSVPAPVLVGSVTSSSSGQFRTDTFYVTCSSSSSIGFQTGTMVSSIGNISSGVCNITFAAGYWPSTAYACIATELGAAVNTHNTIRFVNNSATSMDMYLATSTSGSSTIAADTAANVFVTCTGNR